MANELRDKGITIANAAVEADNAQRYDEAIKGYVKAAEYLLTATKYEKNPVTLATIRSKCLEYTSRAETLKKEAKSALFKERDEFKKGAMWDKPSEAERVKQRILGHADKVLSLQNAYEKAREAWVQARIDDAVQRALKLERLDAAQVYLMYDQLVLRERQIGLLNAQRLLAEHVGNS